MLDQMITRLKAMDAKIVNGRTGTPEVFARAIGISERSIYEYVNLLRKLGAPVEYDRSGGTYYYTSPGNFKIGWDAFEDKTEPEKRPSEKQSRGIPGVSKYPAITHD